MLLILSVFFLVLVLDQITKAIIVALIEENSVSFAGREEALAAAERVRRSSPYRPFPVLR